MLAEALRERRLPGEHPGWDDGEAWSRVYAMRHTSGWVEFCDDGDDPASTAAMRAESQRWLESGERLDNWTDGCLFGCVVGALAASVFWVWMFRM